MSEVELQPRRLVYGDKAFAQQLDHLLAWETVSDTSVQQTVADIVEQVRTRGDAALLEYTNRFDGLSAKDISEVTLNKEQLLKALNNLPSDQRSALEVAARRIRDYHEKQVQSDWSFTEADGTTLGQRITPLDRVGLYVPGGQAAYPLRYL